MTNKIKKQTQNLADANEIADLVKNSSKKKRVLLVDGNLPVDTKNAPYRFGSSKESGFTPLGLQRIQAYLNSFGIDCDLKQLNEIKEGELSNYQIIGVSSLSPSFPDTIEFTKKAKQNNPDTLIIGGGEHFGLDYEWILENKELTGIDACCTMQGELPMLALSLGVPLERVRSTTYSQNNRLISNDKFPRLTETGGLEDILSPRAVKTEIEPISMPEIASFFKGAGSTQTNSGCNYACTFCTNGPFYGKVTPTLETAKKEIEHLQRKGVDFLYVRDPMLNSDIGHLDSFVKFMQNINRGENKMAWYSFMSATPNPIDFSELAKAGSLMVGIGLEDVIGDRRKVGKGNDLDVATKFAESAKEHMLVRALLILGLPNHYQVPKREIKQRMLEYMKSHPQAAYRINILTPTPGTVDYRRFSEALIEDPHTNPQFYKRFDNMNSVVDPKKMREMLGTQELNDDSLYIQEAKEWEDLRNEIILEYINSDEHAKYLESLRGKSFLGRPNLLYDIAKKFVEVNNEI